MDLFKAKGPLVINHPRGGRRVIAELFRVKGGIIFADVGWYGSSGYPFHLVQGEITGEGPWRTNDPEDEASIIEEFDDEDPISNEWFYWETFKASEEGKGATRGLARECAGSDLQARILETWEHS